MAKAGNKQRHRQAVNTVEEDAMDLHEKLGEFEDFKTQILPLFQEVLLAATKGKKTPQELFDMVRAAAAVKQVNIALLDKNSSVALKACKEILDRTEGPVTQKHEVSHLDKMSDEQLEAQILTKMSKISRDQDSDEESDVH